MMTVDKTASQPIYRQVIQALRERLDSYYRQTWCE